jgi:probable rRNA maturation factor
MMAVRIGVQFGEGTAGIRVPGGRRALARDVRTGVRAAFEARAEPNGNISVTLLDDRPMSRLNREYLDHEGPTDVLSFPLFAPGEPVVGDVYLGLEQAERQAAALGVPFREEIVRLAVHGVLHVLGMDHAPGVRRASSALWRLQERIVKHWRTGA